MAMVTLWSDNRGSMATAKAMAMQSNEDAEMLDELLGITVSSVWRDSVDEVLDEFIYYE